MSSGPSVGEGLHWHATCAWCALTIAALTAACGGDAMEQASVIMRDSAGIRIVESPAPVWAAGVGWRVAAEPELTVGTLDGPEQYQLFRAGAALLMPSGEIAVTNTGTFELRFYGPDGAFLRSVGREGGGPGEFQRMGSVWRTVADTLVIFDFGNMRLSVHAGDGSFARTARLQQVAAVPLPMGVFADGSVLAYWHITSDESRTEGLQRAPRMYGLWDPEGAFVDSMARLPGSELYAVSAGADGALATGRPHGRAPVEAAAGDRWYYGSSDRYEIEVRRMDGTLDRIIRRPIANRPVTQELIEEQQRRARERRAERGITTPTPFDDIPYPAEMPAYEGLLLDAAGNLWVLYYRLTEEPFRWAVFDPDGRWLGDVTTPANGRVTDIGDDYVLGIWRDDLDVPQVRMYRLVKVAG